KLDGLLTELAEGDVALVTDAGMPVVSDPGNELVAAAARSGIKIEVVPGPSAVTAALAMSGFAGDAFSFLGFLSRRRNDRQSALREASSSAVPLVIFEAPHRLRATLADMDTVLGGRPLAVCRELTKLHEEVFRGTAFQALEHFDSPRGEVVLVVQGRPIEASSSPEATAEGDAATDTELRRQLIGLREDGIRAKEAVAMVAEAMGLPKNRVYQVWVEVGRKPR
ncbi:MAG: ribosomal RNA small subunit methyltransferase I, partial [Chloroflexota bacterium]|nr:ribosomal RNA small subunit methyltransferase I [Chloroflexota bacterium]